MTQIGGKKGGAAGAQGFDWTAEYFRNATAITERLVAAHQVPRSVQPVSECLRDGLQSSSVSQPTLQERITLLKQMKAIGVEVANIGIPVRGAPSYSMTLGLAMAIKTLNLGIEAYSLARACNEDVSSVAEVSGLSGLPMRVELVMGASGIRQLCAGQDVEALRKLTREFVEKIVDKSGLSVLYIPEDSTRAEPEVLSTLWGEAIDAGADRICIADTAGAIDPLGVLAIVNHALGVIESSSAAKRGVKVGLDFHGHNDSSAGVVNAVHAALLGADRVHGCTLGIGERVGNAALDLILVELHRKGLFQGHLELLPAFVKTFSAAVQVPVPDNYPVLGLNANGTASGMHAHNMLHARKLEPGLENAVYNGVDPRIVGLEVTTLVGPNSGRANIRDWLDLHSAWIHEERIEVTPALIDTLFSHVKFEPRVLPDDRMRELVRQFGHP